MMTENMKTELQKLCGTVLFDEPLSKYTTVRIGGPADALVYPKTVEELTFITAFARKNKIPLFVLGAGSNLLVRDLGIRGIVVSLSQGFNQMKVEEEGVVYVESGVGIPRLVDFTAEEGLTGVEPLAGVPGNVGGALMMNAGTPDGDISDKLVSVVFMDKEGRLITWKKEQVKFGYRESHFPKGAIVLSCRLALSRMASEKIKGKIQGYRAKRVETQPLNVPNLGSVFKNPPTNQKAKKLFAGKLIEETGLKDVRVGGARISLKHGNFIVNEGGAKAKDVLALIGLIRDKVKEKYGILLETEVKVVGEE
jgi:UDP-N-acetylmuramate dehydrogenase